MPHSAYSTIQVNLSTESPIGAKSCFAHLISLHNMQGLQTFDVTRVRKMHGGVEIHSTDLIGEFEALAPIDNLAAGGHRVI